MREENRYNVIIVGGGPSGMACAIELGRCVPSLNILLIEKNEELGRKLRATGSGRCNITNSNAEGYGRCMEFLRRMGIACRVYENGLVYPYSESAADVANILTERVIEAGVSGLVGTSVDEIGRRDDGSYYVICGLKVYDADCLVLATGGKAGPNYGTIGEGYKLAASLAHSIVTTIPVLTSIECKAQGCETLGGIRARGKVSLYKNNEMIFAEDGEIQFTKTGLSGICIFNMTRHMRYARAEGESLEQFRAVLDLMADGDVREYLNDRRTESAMNESEEPIATVLRGLLKPALAEYVLRKAADSYVKNGGEDDILWERIAYMSDEMIEAIACVVHGLEFTPTAVNGWKDAQCTSGGVSMDEIDERTCESKLSSGLYIIGELADYDGPCGGYNLTNAWITGLNAARGINESLQNK